MRNVQETNLAWALIEAAKPRLSARERNDVFVIIGAGDTFAAIRRLFTLAMVKRIPLGSDLVQGCSTWLDTYARHEEEQCLRHLIAGFLIADEIQASTPGQFNLLPTAPPATSHMWLAGSLAT